MNIPRALQNPNDTWNLSPLYSDRVAWEKDLKDEATQEYSALTQSFREKETLSSEDVRALLDLYFLLDRRLRKLYTWAHLTHDQDIADDEGNQSLQQIMSRYHDFMEAVSWIEPKILSHSEQEIKSFLTSKALEP